MNIIDIILELYYWNYKYQLLDLKYWLAEVNIAQIEVMVRARVRIRAIRVRVRAI